MVENNSRNNGDGDGAVHKKSVRRKYKASFGGMRNMETFAVYSFITGAQGASEYWITGQPSQLSIRELASALHDSFDKAMREMIEGRSTREMRLLLTTVGSLWRVDWLQIARRLRK